MEQKDLTLLHEAFEKHLSDPDTITEHFIYHGVRYVVCDKCSRLISVDDAIYYGGEGYLMHSGGCRRCFGKAGDE